LWKAVLNANDAAAFSSPRSGKMRGFARQNVAPRRIETAL
jgi:hypothetical protein